MFRRLRVMLAILWVVLTGVTFVITAFSEDTALEEEIEFTLITDDGEEIFASDETHDDKQRVSSSENEVPVLTPRDDLINRIIQMGQSLYEKANGHAQRAHYASDIYVCKNFTTYLFRMNRDDFCMAEYPNVKLIIPDNLPAKECRPFAYGFLWKDVPPSKGNPFYVGAQFRYDSNLSAQENMEKAVAFMTEVRKGDFFQMSADYEYGVGAHSAIMISDYDAETNTVHWMDSNMRGKKINGIRYGIVQFDEEKSIEWWASCFCHKKRGATLYRLRDDIMYADQ